MHNIFKQAVESSVLQATTPVLLNNENYTPSNNDVVQIYMVL